MSAETPVIVLVVALPIVLLLGSLVLALLALFMLWWGQH